MTKQADKIEASGLLTDAAEMLEADATRYANEACNHKGHIYAALMDGAERRREVAKALRAREAKP